MELAKEQAAKELAAAKKAVEKASGEVDTAKENVAKAEEALKAAEKPEDKKKAEDALAKAKEELVKKIEAVTAIRIKNAQSGSYLPEEKERKLVHVKMDKPSYSRTDGKKISKAYIQKFTIAEWNHFAKNSSGLGYKVEIMWNPALYLV